MNIFEFTKEKKLSFFFPPPASKRMFIMDFLDNIIAIYLNESFSLLHLPWLCYY